MPALLVVVAAVAFYDSVQLQFAQKTIAMLSLLYALYCLSTFLLAVRNDGKWDRTLLVGTIIGDPAMLSIFLYGAGKGAIVFVGFYLFTILGFGFRVGIASMRSCQAVAIGGFALVAYFSPIWREMQVVTASHLVLLIVVPLYASNLIRGLRNAQKTAQYESEAKSRLLANVSHELRTPLTGIISAAQLIEAETAGGELINTKARSISDMAWHLDGEISQLLDLSKLQIGTSNEEIVAFTIDTLVSNVIDAVHGAASTKDLELVVRIDPGLVLPVKGMAQSLRSVLINLVGNAIKFTERGRVEISVEMIEDSDARYQLRFRVSDTGIGIPAEHIGKIFDPFYQVERGSNRKYGGTGLGMAISREHVARMGGRIDVSSKVGEGSVFWFDIALEKAGNKHAAGAGDAGSGIVPSKRVLLADDNATNLALIREMLCRDGHQVVAVVSGTDALFQLANETFDLVMLDYNMHDIDGARVWEIYAISNTAPAPTYFITADTTDKTKAHLLSLGATGVIYKPITFAMIRKMLSDVFPGESMPNTLSMRKPVATQSPGHLVAVAAAHMNHDVLENLADINPSPQFARRLLSDAKDDIAQIARDMSDALLEGNVTAIRRHGHSLKGVSLNIGAPRLAAFGEKMMSSSFEAIQGGRRELDGSLKQEVAGTFAAIDDLLQGLDGGARDAIGAGVKNVRS